MSPLNKKLVAICNIEPFPAGMRKTFRIPKTNSVFVFCVQCSVDSDWKCNFSDRTCIAELAGSGWEGLQECR